MLLIKKNSESGKIIKLLNCSRPIKYIANSTEPFWKFWSRTSEKSNFLNFF